MLSLFVGELHNGVSEKILRELFSRSGKLESIRICRNPMTLRSLGFAYIKFTRPEDAELAFHMFGTSPSLYGHVRWTADSTTNQLQLDRSEIGNRLFRIIKTLHSQLAATTTQLMMQLDQSEIISLLANPKALKRRANKFWLIIRKMLNDFFIANGNQTDMIQQLAELSQVKFAMTDGRAFNMIVNVQEILNYMDSESYLFGRLAANKKPSLK